MELLIAFAITLVGELTKLLSKRFGEATSKNIVLGMVLVLSLTYALLTGANLVTQEMLAVALKVALSAVGIYELVVKRIVYPAVGSSRQK